MRLRLLPRDNYSWTCYVWLVYLGTPIWYSIAGPRQNAFELASTAAAIVTFLPLYFWGYWLDGWRLLVPIGAIATIAVVLSPINPGASVFFVYASGFAGRIGRPSRGTLIVVTLLAILALETWLVGLRPEAWGPAAPLMVMIGGLNIVFTEIGRTQVTLRRAAEAEAQRMAVVAERERIGRDLHDLLGHTLSVITLKAELASKLSSQDPVRSLAEIRDVERISREALAEVREAVLGHRAYALADELRHARAALAAAGIALDSQMRTIALEPTGEQALALALREGATNVIRHSAARHCVIRLDQVEGLTRLEITDDGVGGSSPEGSGLLGMRARLKGVGGGVERDGRKGTRLVITLPMTYAALPGTAGLITT